jgi:hypothetical protein
VQRLLVHILCFCPGIIVHWYWYCTCKPTYPDDWPHHLDPGHTKYQMTATIIWTQATPSTRWLPPPSGPRPHQVPDDCHHHLDPGHTKYTILNSCLFTVYSRISRLSDSSLSPRLSEYPKKVQQNSSCSNVRTWICPVKLKQLVQLGSFKKQNHLCLTNHTCVIQKGTVAVTCLFSNQRVNCHIQ